MKVCDSQFLPNEPPFDRMPGSVHGETRIPHENAMYRLITAGFVLALGLSLPFAGAGEKAADNPAVKKLNRDIPRHKEFLSRIEKTSGAGDVIFLGDSITHGWEGQTAWQEHFGAFKP